jgi:dimethylamine/trimethylamine dehydrogenase
VSRLPAHDILFEPVQLGPKVMRNRFCQVPHCTGSGSEYPGFQSGLRGLKAEGGWAAVFTESASISPETPVDGYETLRFWDDGDVRNLAAVCDAVHAHDSLMGIELWYSAGAAIVLNEARRPLRGPSQIPSDRVPYGYLGSCHEMDLRDIDDLVEMHAGAARRARAAGFDLVTIYMSHATTLPLRFLIPAYNRRTDDYGGSFENRSRLARRILEATRAAVGDELAIGVRFSVDTLDPPFGLGADGVRADGEGGRFIAEMDHLVDYWDINIGGTDWGEDAGPSRDHLENHQRPFVSGVHQHTAKPVINVGRFTNPDTMAAAVSSGQCDIIGSARPSIADPFLPRKIEEGRLDDIRECIGCNICIARFNLAGSQIICTQNATMGEEFRRGWHPERFTRARNAASDVLVVGAGPAGMECARVLGERGMHGVHLVEAGADIGGCMRWIRQLPGLGEWGRVIDYRRIQLDKLANVQVITGRELDLEDVLEYGAEIVIVATGSRWSADGLNGVSQGPVPIAEAARGAVLTPEGVMSGAPVGQRVTIFDTDGYFVGPSIAEKLARDGHDVCLVTPLEGIAPYMQVTLELPRVKHTLRELGVELVRETLLTAVEPGVARMLSLDTGQSQDRATDTVVMATFRHSVDSLYRQLVGAPEKLATAAIAAVHQIGDCVQPDLIAEAIYSGHRLAREIDADDPSVPLPYIRERRLIGGTDADYTLDGQAVRSSQ